MKSLQHGFRMAFDYAEEGPGGSFGMAVALLPILERAGADANQCGKLGLAETEFFTDGFGVGPLEGGGAGCFLFAAQDGTAFLETGGELLEEFVFHGCPSLREVR